MSLAEFDVTGQKVLIVGAGRGIGKGIALAFAEAGADVAIASLTEGTVGKVAEEIRAMGQTALPVTGDATKAADMDRIASQVLAEFGHIDTLVTCVGDSIRKPVVQLPGSSEEGMTEDDWNHVSVGRRGRHIFRVATVQVHSDALAIGAGLVQAHVTVVAHAAGHPVVQDHPVADLERCIGVGADGGYLTSDVATQDPG